MMKRGAKIVAVILVLGMTALAGAQTRTLVAYAGSYSANRVYSLNDMVLLGGNFYISLVANNRGNAPVTSATEWASFSSGSGSSSANGATGAAGLVGAMGPEGPQGLPGVAGAMGPTGAAGAMGPTGRDGATGVAGAPGAMGFTGPAGAAGPAGPPGSGGVAGGNGAAGTVRETRIFSLEAHKGINIAAGGTMILFSATGPGNVERIQIAAGYNSGSPSQSPIGANSVLTIAVDGKSYSCTLGMFLLWNGYTTSDGAAATSDLFVTKYLGITSAVSTSNENISGYRRIYIKYNSSIQISIAIPAFTNINWWTQVEFYPGVAPVGRYPATRDVFHMFVNDWAPIAPGQVVQVLPAVLGAGELESIYFVTSAPIGSGVPGWLEQAPTINVDGTIFRYGGTEDFFGNQFYGTQFHGRTDEYGIARFFNSGNPDNTTYWTGYRYFRESPMIFNSGLGMIWQNAGSSSEPAAKMGTLAVYYTTE